MSSKKDMRRADLSKFLIPVSASASCPVSKSRSVKLTQVNGIVIPYQEPAAKTDAPEFQSTLSSTLPMAAIFMRNRYIGW